MYLYDSQSYCLCKQFKYGQSQQILEDIMKQLETEKGFDLDEIQFIEFTVHQLNKQKQFIDLFEMVVKNNNGLELKILQKYVLYLINGSCLI